MSIFKREDRKAYYCKVGGKFVKLDTDRAKALEKWHRLVAEVDQSPATVPTVRELLKSYFDWCQVNLAKSTCVRREPVLKRFSQEYGKMKASAIRPHYVTRWVDHHWAKCSNTTRHDHIVMIQAAYGWATRQEILQHNPIAGMEKPRPNVREHFVPAEDWPTLLAACSPPFDDIVRFSLLTGCRAQESRLIEAQHVKTDTIVLPIADSKGNRKNRVIYLSTPAKDLVRRLCAENPDGKIFRNTKGNPWKKDALNCRMKRVKIATGWDWLTMTTLRHSFAHAQVQAGTDALLLQQLTGHADGRMLARVYAHADKAPDQLKAAIESTSHHLAECEPVTPA